MRRLALRFCCFNTQPPEGGWPCDSFGISTESGFQHTAARRRLVSLPAATAFPVAFQHTAARRRLVAHAADVRLPVFVSTHSRPKAAGPLPHRRMRRPKRFNTQPPEGGWREAEIIRRRDAGFQHTAARRRLDADHAAECAVCGFNTQPPEGGWLAISCEIFDTQAFQHTAARRRLGLKPHVGGHFGIVSTHSRPKAAGIDWQCRVRACTVSTHSRPKAAGRICPLPPNGAMRTVSTHSRPKAAGRQHYPQYGQKIVSTHSRPKAAGRRIRPRYRYLYVSTHSRPKAAAAATLYLAAYREVSTHSRPKAAGCTRGIDTATAGVSTHSRPKAAGALERLKAHCDAGFNTQPPEGGWLHARN